jgi:DNA repair protein RecN (Recombination protein N)
MLVHLSISNFAIIRQLDIMFRPGLNILSGETGAGKSIIINAMNLILGGRASSELIRSGCEEAKVEALFSFPDRPALADILSEAGLPFEGELLVKRTIFKEGRNRITINDSMITLQTLTRIGAALVSISGQHEHQLLLKPESHLFLLDEFGGVSEDRMLLSGLVRRFQLLGEQIGDVRNQIKGFEDRQELARYQAREIEGVGMRLGEDEQLSEERKRLQRAEEILAIASEGYENLYERHDSVLAALSQFTRKLEKGVELDPALRPIKETLEDVALKLEDAALALRDFQKGIRVDPGKLEEVEQRLQLLNGLKRKYGPGLEDVLAFKNRLDSMVDDLDNKKEELSQLEKVQEGTERELVSVAKGLSEKRKKVAEKFERDVEKELQDLHMNETRFRVHFHQLCRGGEVMEECEIEQIRTDGYDRLEFMIAPNPGEDLKPLSRIASGGELSRIMLALKTILARTASIETVIFDEVDSGISGATAEVVGEKLLSLSNYHQILCITHLPQIASKGQTHYQVKKEIQGGRSQTTISELDPASRVQEIARLLGGKEITRRAVAHAKEMLG